MVGRMRPTGVRRHHLVNESESWASVAVVKDSETWASMGVTPEGGPLGEELPLAPLAKAVLYVPPDPERVLQIACGEGDGVLFLAREFPRARVRGVDRSLDAVRAAVGRVGLDPEGRVAFKHVEGRHMPYPDAHFDLVVQTGSRPALPEILRVLRPGGFLILLRVGHTRRAWPNRRLRWRGFEIAQTGEVGGGAFCVSALSGTGRHSGRH